MKMFKVFLLFLLFIVKTGDVVAQDRIKIFDSKTRAELSSASIRVIGRGAGSNQLVSFVQDVKAGDTLEISHVGYVTQKLTYLKLEQQRFAVLLEKAEGLLEEIVVNTGYARVPRERFTGSFESVGNQDFNRRVGGTILDRIDGLVTGVQFVRPNSTSASGLRIRGLATIQSNETPLVVVDNFVYEGNLDMINPQDVENISVLKDAAAASIWGARAGNGVIVITTKKGRQDGRTDLNFSSHFSITNKPDLFYSKRFLPSPTIMQIEREKYEKGYYLISDQQQPFPEYVELLIAKDRGEISEMDFQNRTDMLANADVRKEALKYLYRTGKLRQYGLNIRGGSQMVDYSFGIGYDTQDDILIGNDMHRFSITLKNGFRLSSALRVDLNVNYTTREDAGNGVSLENLSTGLANFGLSPYIRLRDGNGNALPVIRDYRRAYVDQANEQGLLDWSYVPLENRWLEDRRTNSVSFRGGTSVNWTPLRGASVNVSYQLLRNGSSTENFYEKESYYVRNLVNRFTPLSGSSPIPYGDILQRFSNNAYTQHAVRVQANYTGQFRERHEFAGLVGLEASDGKTDAQPGFLLYNYDKEHRLGENDFDYTFYHPVRPTGSGRIPSPPSASSLYIDRFLSYYGNMSYTMEKKYGLSASVRWDGSNLFGVKANQKGTPLWSIGTSWEINREAFYPFRNELPYLRIRTTFGHSGNVNKSVSAYPIIYLLPDGYREGIVTADLQSAGNPSLKWEKVSTINAGLDWKSRGNVLDGSLEFYRKDGSDLIGEDFLPPSSGIITGGTATRSNLVNYASIRSSGMDLRIGARPFQGRFRWTPSMLISYVENKVTKLSINESLLLSDYLNSPASPRVGKSRDVLYAMPWYGLSHDKGIPIMYIDGEQTTDYGMYYKSLGYEDLLDVGVTVPKWYGSFRNDFHWNGISMSFMLSFKAGHVFRRGSMPMAGEFSSVFHEDYFKRWQKPGDESTTYVPAYQETAQPYSATVYLDSEVLIERGDMLRFKDISIAYTFSKSPKMSKLLKEITCRAYISDVGLLWTSNRAGIDPDYIDASYYAPRRYALGIQIGL